ncbi:hypothetical protein N5079_26085 [Planotetraspora sp. A-T 1434]|uniref:hypothetical protein n=1 Tax=Planotetraspora sp. A-T 1434 TaxID=2979219 RepID=UPI0021C00DDF|nr:hypothetical protein [Planotetraspora sp. A-T 1434]MCT9933689.1 hypothetical protein [Planotetraspora sp. A-T 1434]
MFRPAIRNALPHATIGEPAGGDLPGQVLGDPLAADSQDGQPCSPLDLDLA